MSTAATRAARYVAREGGADIVGKLEALSRVSCSAIIGETMRDAAEEITRLRMEVSGETWREIARERIAARQEANRSW